MSYIKDKLISVRVDSRLYNKVIEIISRKHRWQSSYVSVSDLLHKAMESFLKDNSNV